MVNPTRYRCLSVLWKAPTALVLLVLLWTSPAWPLGITAQSDKGEVRVGESVTVTVVGLRSDTALDPFFAGAGLQVPPLWRRGGQSAQSARRDGDQTLKSWKFELIAEAPGTTYVTPVIYLGSDPSLRARADSMLGAPIALVILPLPGLPLWPWFLGAALVAVGTYWTLSRSLRKRRERLYSRRSLPPLEEALGLLESIGGNRRVDRAQQYLSDIERVLHGYCTRRLAADLSGKTPSEIAAAVAERVPDTQCAGDLRELLRQCAASKFGGVRIEFETLANLEQRARQVLEQLDRSWV